MSTPFLPKVKFWARVGATVWASGIGILELLAYFSIIAVNPIANPIIWLTSLLMLGVGSVGNIFIEAHEKRKKAKEKTVESLFQPCTVAFQTLVFRLTKEGKYRYEDFGGSVYIRERSTAPAGRLERVYRFRPGIYPIQSDVAWNRNKGAVGECWRDGRPIYRDLHEIAESVQNGVEKKTYRTIDKKWRDGFTHSEYQSIRPKYCEVYAMPIFGLDNKKIIGVLSVDRKYVQGEVFEESLGTTGSMEEVAATVATLTSVLEKHLG